MDFLISDTFTSSLARLMGEEQRAAKTTAFDLQINPATPGIQLHRLDKTRDKNFWSARVNRDLRVIIHRSEQRMMLCYVGHHNDAYAWAARRRIEEHPVTGAAQLVEIRETVREIAVPHYVPTPVAMPTTPAVRHFQRLTSDELLGYGVPADWVDEVREATEDQFMDLWEHLPAEAAESLLRVATGQPGDKTLVSTPSADPFTHPQAQRRFRVVSTAEELQSALDFPWEQWVVFLHPSQRSLVEKQWNGAVRVAGSAGTGKTIVAVHRAVWMVQRDPEARVLLTTFSRPLATSLHQKVRILVGNRKSLLDRITVGCLQDVARKLAGDCGIAAFPFAADSDLEAAVEGGRRAGFECSYSNHFLVQEWKEVIDARSVQNWEDYRGVSRVGRKTRLGEPQRQAIWRLIQKANEILRTEQLSLPGSLYRRIVELDPAHRPYFDGVIVDEAQDVSYCELSLLVGLSGGYPESMFFSGDQGQRIFQSPFSWKSAGVDIRGRSRILRVNYRTSMQIRKAADQLLPNTVTDLDGNDEERSGTISVFRGPDPEIELADDATHEQVLIAGWIQQRLAEGFAVPELAIFVRSEAQLDRAHQAILLAGYQPIGFEESGTETTGILAATMHVAKGLEFRAVIVMACDEDVIPSEERICAISDSADLKEVYDTERHLLYVACTRARDRLLVTAVDPESEFLADLQ